MDLAQESVEENIAAAAQHAYVSFAEVEVEGRGGRAWGGSTDQVTVSW